MNKEELLDRTFEELTLMDLIFYDNPNGPYEYHCVLCSAEDYRISGDPRSMPTMESLDHAPDCVYRKLQTHYAPELLI